MLPSLLPSFCGEYFLCFSSYVSPELKEKLDDNTDDELLGSIVALYESYKSKLEDRFYYEWKRYMSYVYDSRTAVLYDRFFELYPQERALLHPVYR